MLPQINLTYFFSALLILVSSCGKNYYFPNSIPAMIDVNSNDHNLQIDYNTYSDPFFYNNQIGVGYRYGLTDRLNLGTQIGFYFKGYSRIDEENTTREDINDFRFNPVIAAKLIDNKLFKFEVMGGINYLNFVHDYPNLTINGSSDAPFIKGNYYTTNIAPSIAYYTEKIKYIFSIESVNLKYFGIKGNFEYNGVDQVKYLQQLKPQFFYKSAFTIAYILPKNGELRMQLGFNNNFRENGLRDYSKVFLNFTLAGKIWKKKPYKSE